MVGQLCHPMTGVVCMPTCLLHHVMSHYGFNELVLLIICEWIDNDKFKGVFQRLIYYSTRKYL